MAVIDLKSSYLNALKEADIDKNKIADWEEALTGLQTTLQTAYEAESTPIKQQTSYDISQAYENYKKTQLNLLQNQQLGAGLREHLGSELSSKYGETYSGIRAQEKAQLSKLSSEYATQYNKYYKELQSSLEKEATKLSDIEKALLSYRGLSGISQAEELEYIQNGELTDEGRDFYAKSFLDQNAETGESAYFGDYLAKTNPELYEYFAGNRAKVMQLVGGLDAEDVGKSYSQSSVYAEQSEKLRKDIEAQIKPLTDTQRAWFENETGVSIENALREGTTPSEKRKTLQQIKETTDKIPTHRQNEAIKVKDGYIYGNQKYKTTYVGNSSKTANDITRDLDLKKKIKSGEVQYGDVVVWNGNSYVVTKSTSQIPNFELLKK